MLKNYFRLTFRNLFKNKSYTLLNVGGLALGIVCAVLIFSVIRFELSFDTYHRDVDRIYRVVHEENEFGEIKHDAGISYPMPAALKTDFPEIETLAIVDGNMGPPVISVTHEDGSISRYREQKGVAYASTDFFKIFHYDWLAGNPETALESPNSVVISNKLAQKYFSGKNPLGKTLGFDNDLNLQITGIIGEPPPNTDFPFTMLVALDLENRGDTNWGNIYGLVQCYLKLSEQADPEQLTKRFPDFLARHRGKDDMERFTFHLQPLSELHFDTRYVNYNRTISQDTLLALALIGLALLLTACINFVNLNTALAINRSKEVGVRKVLGGTRAKLIWQFMGETAMTILLAICLSLSVVELAVGRLNSILGYKLELHLFSNLSMMLFLGALFVLITIIAGFYPALYLSRFSPIESLRNRLTARYTEGLTLRKGLVVLQFLITQVLILATVIIASQMNYLRTKDMGFTKEAVVEVELPENDDGTLHRFKTQLLQQPSIKQVGFSNTGTASSSIWGGDYTLKVGEQIKEGHAQIKFVDQDFVETYGVRLLAGQNFGAADTLQQFLVNETFAKEAGFGNDYQGLLGNYLDVWNREAPIGGIVKDFNTTSFHQKVEPVILLMQNRFHQAGIKIAEQNVPQTLKQIEQIWSEVYPNYVFDYAFLDDTVAKFYEQEQQTAHLLNLFTVLAILIGCLGLLGLVSFMTTRRTKEIGIRKVLGATFANILTMLTKEFAILVLIAFVVAAPLAGYFTHSWLENFAYRIKLNTSVFLFALAASFAIAFLTIGYSSFRTALANPVDSLRHE